MPLSGIPRGRLTSEPPEVVCRPRFCRSVRWVSRCGLGVTRTGRTARKARQDVITYSSAGTHGPLSALRSVGPPTRRCASREVTGMTSIATLRIEDSHAMLSNLRPGRPVIRTGAAHLDVFSAVRRSIHSRYVEHCLFPAMGDRQPDSQRPRLQLLPPARGRGDGDVASRAESCRDWLGANSHRWPLARRLAPRRAARPRQSGPSAVRAGARQLPGSRCAVSAFARSAHLNRVAAVPGGRRRRASAATRPAPWPADRTGSRPRPPRRAARPA